MTPPYLWDTAPPSDIFTVYSKSLGLIFKPRGPSKSYLWPILVAHAPQIITHRETNKSSRDHLPFHNFHLHIVLVTFTT